ncbi:hypothetical protein F511_24258 [Dorcoceras hygrometricum]|uniref:Uncharacterized protein n=1 Tax=Dorcoceras hygrometricum TaxID=472368 RepID=A0A2Z7CIL5_9LAMI|nr:hypothetical protein F511_24258 [Dorcoceras hygrometricum]
MGNTDPNNTKAGKEIRGQASVRRAIKIANHAIINAMKCMRAIKDRISRPVYQLAKHLNQPLYPHGTTHQSANHNVAFNQVINQSVNQARDVCIIISADFTTSITAMFTLKLLNLLNSYLQQLISTSIDSQGTAQTIEANQPASATEITVETPWNSNLYQVSNNQINSNSTSKVLGSSSIIQLPNPTEYFSTLKRGLNLTRNHLPKSTQHPKNALPDFSRNLRTPAASRSIPQVILQSLMGNNRKSKPQGVQRHPNRQKQRLKSTEI